MTRAATTYRTLTILALAAALGGCAGIRPPSMQLTNLKLKSMRLTGAGLDIELKLRNRDPEPLDIERFSYTLRLDGHELGEGYYSEPLLIDGFDEATAETRFDINFLKLPGTIKALLEGSDKVDAQVTATFHIRRGERMHKARMSARAMLPVGR